jgi:hypothetical protein
MSLLALCVILITVVQVICLLALVDQYHGLLQIREALGLVDTPQELAIDGAEQLKPSTVGLPSQLDNEEVAVVVLLSTKCGTCRSIGRGFQGRVSSPAWAVIAAESRERGEEWLADVGLSGERLVMDVGGTVAERLKLKTFPSAVIFTRGSVESARTLPSYRQLSRLLGAGVDEYSKAKLRGSET